MPPRLSVLCCLFSVSAIAQEKVTFNEHIRPILSDNCFACHGKDASHREARLRLDNADGATAAREGLPAITPGQLEKSELWWRITTADPEEQMPPADSHKKPLSPEQRTLIKRWIEQGAAYQNHWAYEPVSRPALPAPAAGAGEHPVDRFLGAKLAAHHLKLAPEASPEVLIRRVTLDLTGLPPTPQEVDAFVAAYGETTKGRKDGETGRQGEKPSAATPPISASLLPSVSASPRPSVSPSPAQREAAYAALVDRLLASPRYGEHFGRAWLDAVRYADTHGLHLDNVRTIWPYRDWVVQAFNRNLHYDQFTIEQLAGDLLPKPRIDQLVATGYNRNHLSTSEGGAIEAEAEMRNTADRVDTTAAVWMGLTANCASCHDHKFDPLTQKEYYSLGAIFKGLADRPWDGNVRLSGPVAVIADSPAKQRRVDEITTAIKPLEAMVTRRADELTAEKMKPKKPGKTPIAYEVVWAEDSDLPTPENVMAPPAAGEWRRGAEVPLAGGERALRMEGHAERPIAFTAGDVVLTVRTEATAFVNVYLDPANPPRAISLEFISEEKTRRMIWGDAEAFGADVARNAIAAGPLPPVGSYMRLELKACDSGVEEGKDYSGLRLAQSDGTAWWDRIGAAYKSPSASDDPLLSQDAWARSQRTGARAFAPVPLRHDINFLVGLSGTQQDEEEKKRIATWYRDYIYAPLRSALEPEVHAARRLLAEQVHYEMTFPVTLISGERAEPRPAHVLLRGQYDKPGELVTAATPAFLPPIEKSGERVTRLDFARWLVSPQHPLTSRVAVNRFWQQLFGAGLVRTPADFGAQGEPPTHPQLLDWLASEFMRTGWDVKKFVQLLVTSRAYRQDSNITPELLEQDPANKLLAYGPRLRLDAEVLRDQALALGGLLRPEIGGPPVKPYQPINIWEPVAFGGSNTKTYVQDHGEALYRRSLYTFMKRTAPAPAMSTFDAPSRETFCVGRNRSDTPLQALALMNDVQHFEAARGFAERLLNRPSNEPERLVYAFRCVAARPPTKAEQTLLGETLATHRAHFAKDTEAASQVVRNGESKPSSTLPVVEVAAWTMVANLLLNLDEAITRN